MERELYYDERDYEDGGAYYGEPIVSDDEDCNGDGCGDVPVLEAQYQQYQMPLPLESRGTATGSLSRRRCDDEI